MGKIKILSTHDVLRHKCAGVCRCPRLPFPTHDTAAKLSTQVANLSTGPPPIDYRLVTTSPQQTE